MKTTGTLVALVASVGLVGATYDTPTTEVAQTTYGAEPSYVPAPSSEECDEETATVPVVSTYAPEPVTTSAYVQPGPSTTGYGAGPEPSSSSAEEAPGTTYEQGQTTVSTVYTHPLLSSSTTEAPVPDTTVYTHPLLPSSGFTTPLPGGNGTYSTGAPGGGSPSSSYAGAPVPTTQLPTAVPTAGAALNSVNVMGGSVGLLGLLFGFFL